MISGCVVSILALSLSGLGIPRVMFIALLLIAGAACGAFSASVPAVLREKLGTNELVVSLMLNYVLMHTSNYLLKTFIQDRSAPYTMSYPLPKEVHLSNLVSRTDIHSGLFIALAMVMLTIVVFYRTPLGTSIRICGSNPNFACYSGISMTGCLILAQVLSGALAGLGGAVDILGIYDRFQWTSLTQYGFDGLMVAVLARKNPVFVPFGAFLLAYMRIGANILNFNTSVPIEFVQVMQAVIIILIAAQTFLEKYKNRIVFKDARINMKKEESL